MSIKKHIPNTITCLNLFCGGIAIVLASCQKLEYAAIMIIIAAIFDFFDGFAARLLKTNSTIGKELDSLSDVVSFGVAPSIITYQWLLPMDKFNIQIAEIAIVPIIFCLLFACCAALRLAKFNLDNRQSDVFFGLPTPAAAFTLIALPFFEKNTYMFYIGLCILIVLCFAMLSNIKLLSLKFHNFKIKENFLRYFLVLIGLILIIIFQFKAIPIIILIYIVFSLIDNLLTKKEI